jgi:uncharacterized OB-fold protein
MLPDPFGSPALAEDAVGVRVKASIAIPRTPPIVRAETAHFWQGGRDGKLQFLRCASCGYYIHPPGPVCPSCLSRDVHVDAVSGRGTVFSYTINRQQMGPEPTDPFVIASVEIEEQTGLRITTNIVRCPIEDVTIGLPVAVTFEAIGDIYLPLFVPRPM